MKLFHYTYGIISAVFAFMVAFNFNASEFIDEYWLDILYDHYAKEWWYTNVIISGLFVMYTLIWVYNLGKGIEEKEPSLIKKENE